MELNWKTLAGAAGVWMLIVLNSKDRAERRLNMPRIQVVDVDVDWYRIRLMLNIQNPTSGNMVIRSLVGDLYVNGVKVANVQSFGFFNVKANGQLVLPVEGKFKTANMVQAILSAFQGKKTFELLFNGTVNLNSEALPLKFSYTVNAPKF